MCVSMHAGGSGSEESPPSASQAHFRFKSRLGGYHGSPKVILETSGHTSTKARTRDGADC